jgi:hypothetical protein
MPINKDNIPHILENLKDFATPRFKKSLSLSASEKHTMFRRIVTETPKLVHIPVRSPFVTSFNTFFKQKIQYGFYALPLVLIAFFANYSDAFSVRLKALFNDFKNTQSEIQVAQSSIEAKMSLSKAQKEIYALKAATENTTAKDALVAQVSTRSKEVRNKVAALIEENKITEAKEIVLDLEAALKADQLFAVAPQVADEVFAAIDLRVELEKKEVVNIAFATGTASTTPEVDLRARIVDISKELDGFTVNASSSDMIAEAKASLKKAEDYIVAGDIQAAVITLQACDRIVADLRRLLVQ